MLPITRGVREPEVEAGDGVGLTEASADGPEPGRFGRHRPPLAGRPAARRTLLELLPSDTILLEEAAGPDADEVQRAWSEAEHHLEVARRLGEDVPERDEILEPPEDWRERLGVPPAARCATSGSTSSSASSRPRRSTAISTACAPCWRRARRRSSSATTRASSSGSRSCSRTAPAARARATLAIGALDGGFVMPSLRVLTDHEIFRRARRLRRARRYRQAAPSAATGRSGRGDYVVHLEHGIGIYRGIETIFVGRVHHRSRGRRVRGRRPAQRAALPARPARALSRRRRRRRPPAAAPPPARRLDLGSRCARRPAQAIKQMTAELLDLYARRKVTARLRLPARHPLAARARVELSLRGHARPAQGDRRGQARHGAARARWTGCSSATSATARPRSRCARRSRRCRAGSRSRCWCPTTILAEQHGRTFIERLADFPDQDRGAVPLPDREGAEGGARAARRRADRHRHRHPPPALEGRRVQGPRPAHRGRGAPLRREAQGAAQGAPAVGGRAHAHRDADPAHAAPLARRAARPDADPDAAARPLADPHLRRAVGRRADRGGVRARARSRRPGVLRPQPHRDHRDDRGPGPGTRAARAGRRGPRPDGGGRAGGRDAPASWPARSTSSSPR